MFRDEFSFIKAGSAHFEHWASLKSALYSARNYKSTVSTAWCASGWGATGWEAQVQLLQGLNEEGDVPADAPGTDGRPHTKHSYT